MPYTGDTELKITDVILSVLHSRRKYLAHVRLNNPEGRKRNYKGSIHIVKDASEMCCIWTVSQGIHKLVNTHFVMVISKLG